MTRDQIRAFNAAVARMSDHVSILLRDAADAGNVAAVTAVLAGHGAPDVDELAAAIVAARARPTSVRLVVEAS